jgi:hypothetical protein
MLTTTRLMIRRPFVAGDRSEPATGWESVGDRCVDVVEVA